MPQIKMRPASTRIMKVRPVIAAPPDEALVRGHGDIDYVCAGCDRVIAQNVAAGEIKNLVFEAPPLRLPEPARCNSSLKHVRVAVRAGWGVQKGD